MFSCEGVLVLPAPPSDPVPPAPVPTAVRHAPLPREVLVGIALVVIGLAFTAGSYVWSYFGIRQISPRDLPTYFQVEDALFLVDAVTVNVGFFLILWGILRRLPSLGVWSVAGPILILIGAAALAAFYLAELAYAPVLYLPTGGTAPPAWLYTVLPGVLIFGGVATSLGMLVALVGVARGIMAQRTGPFPPARL